MSRISIRKTLDSFHTLRYNKNTGSYLYDLIFYGGTDMEKKDRAIKDKRYEEKHKAERKAKCMVWGTSVPREKAERINEFLKKYGYTKVQLIEAGYEELLARHDTDFAKKTL